MRQFIPLIFVAGFLFIIAACSSLPTDWTGISEEDVQLWTDGGFAPAEAQEWKSVGFKPDEAASWKSAGFDLDTAVKWQKDEFDAVEAKAWRAMNYSLKKAIKYRDKGMMPRALRSSDPGSGSESR